MPASSDTPRCSFCERPARETDSLVAGPDVYICDRCISDAAGIVSGEREQSRRAASELTGPLPAPHRLKARLDEHVVGQERAKKILSVAVYNHYKRVRAASEETGHATRAEADGELRDVELEKANVLLLGPTGTGKTLLARTLARLLEVPFCIADATTLTEAGYVGEDVESILSQLLHAADFDTDRAERGIVYLDEVDKLARRRAGASLTRDVSGQGVQQALLKLLEGTVAGVPPEGGRKHPEQPLVQLDTTGILFVCGGAFGGLEEIVERRLSRQTDVGFRAVPQDGNAPQGGNASAKKGAEDGRALLFRATPEDLLEYGFIPELVGRLPVIGPLGTLSKQALRRILTEPRDALVKQYRKRFALDGFELAFDEAALEAVVEQAQALDTGARGLRAVLEEVMLDVTFELHRRTGPARCRITAGVVEGMGAPVYEPLAEQEAPRDGEKPAQRQPWARRA